MRYGWFAFFLPILMTGVTARADQSLQALESIQAAIENVVSAELQQGGKEYRMEPLRLNARLRLTECEHPLDAFILSGQSGSGYFSVGVRCNGVKPWTIYHKVRVSVYESIVILKNQVRQGTVIKASDLLLEKRELTGFHGGYFTDPGMVVGQVARRSLAGGLVLNNEHLLIPSPIQRGQQVSIRVRSADFEIAMPGVALSDGKLGQRIRVRNVASGKIVEGMVTGTGVVSVD